MIIFFLRNENNNGNAHCDCMYGKNARQNLTNPRVAIRNTLKLQHACLKSFHKTTVIIRRSGDY